MMVWIDINKIDKLLQFIRCFIGATYLIFCINPDFDMILFRNIKFCYILELNIKLLHVGPSSAGTTREY